MDTQRFDDIVRLLGSATARRRLLLGLVASPLTGLVATRLSVATEATKKRRPRKPKQAMPNEYGCLDVGDPCKRESQCCSGICAGKKGKRKCRSHDTGTCVQGAPGLCTAPNPETTACNNADCTCYRTTAGSNFCSSDDSLDFDVCVECQRDTDCEELGFPPGSACTIVSQGRCAGDCETGTACLLPCGYAPPGSA